MVGWFTSSFDSEVQAAISFETFVPRDKSHFVIHQKALGIDNSRPKTYSTVHNKYIPKISDNSRRSRALQSAP